jgi:hypothetical protein
VALDELTDRLDNEEQGEVVLRPEAVLRRTDGVVVGGVRHDQEYDRRELWCTLAPTNRVQKRPKPPVNGSISVIRGSRQFGKNFSLGYL